MNPLGSNAEIAPIPGYRYIQKLANILLRVLKLCVCEASDEEHSGSHFLEVAASPPFGKHEIFPFQYV